jgi:hypothetical protein
MKEKYSEMKSCNLLKITEKYNVSERLSPELHAESRV